MSHAHGSSLVIKLIKKEFVFLTMLALLAIIFSIGSHASKPFASAEVQFTDSSESGLAIVPASCPSNPHVGGECTAPVMNNVVISPKPVAANNVNQYTITETSSDANGAGQIIDQYTLINYLGVNAPNYRGYAAWSADNFVGFGGSGTMKNIVACSGGGQGAIYNAGYGQTYISLVSCSTSIAGTTKTTNFVVKFDPSFTTPTTNNYLAGYVLDTTGMASGWVNFDFFNLAPVCTVNQYWNGSVCVNYVCTGTVPGNGAICASDNTGLTADTPNTVAAACGAPKCEYTCNSGFQKSGNTCVSFVCTGTVPSNGAMCASDNTGLVADTPNTVAASCGAPKCEYTCNSGFVKSGNTCVAASCTGTVPSNGTMCAGDNTGLLVDTPNTVAAPCGAPKCEYTCNAGFVKNANTCVAAPTCNLSANPTSIATPNSSLLTWSTTNGSTFSINQGIGAKPLSGTQSVVPGSTITYTGTVTNATGQTATCNATVTVTTCTGGQTWDSGTSSCICPANTSLVGGVCVPPAPTALGFSCSVDATQATVTWTNAPGVTKNNINVDHTANSWTGACPAVNAGDVCVTNVVGVPPYVVTTIPTHTYNTTVYAGNANGTGAVSSNLAVTCACPAGQSLSGNVCVCPASQQWDGNKCANRCTGGQVWNGSACICQVGTTCTCPAGQTWNGSSCVSICTGGQYWNGTACACHTGQTLVNGTCTGSCTDSFFCQGGNQYHQLTNCTNSLSQTCGYGCSAGSCLFAPAALINFTVTPLLVQPTQTVQVAWSTSNASSCTIKNGNVTLWSGLSGTQTSAPIQSQTVFTITCIAVSGQTVKQSATVNLIPVFCEPGRAGCN